MILRLRHLLFLSVIVFLTVGSAHAAASVAEENQLPGTSDWWIDSDHGDSGTQIDGYASSTSVAQGGTIDLFVSTPRASYTITVYRIGWYGGLGGRQMTSPVSRTGQQQPSCPIQSGTHLISCSWSNPYSLAIPSSWVSGVYVAKLVTDNDRRRYILFVVRDDSRPSPYVFQSSVNTFQAYNPWGGYSLYEGPPGQPPATKVSFNRPYAYETGCGQFFVFEINMVRWLEREGYDVTYITDVDTHASLNQLLLHKAFFSVGHDEYWSWQMRDNVIHARDAGVSLGFFTANACYWQVRFEDANRTIVAYRDPAVDPLNSDPSQQYLVTTQWRLPPVNRPEAQLLGVMYEYYSGWNVTPQTGNLHVNEPLHWLLQDTGLTAGSEINGVLGYEVDKRSAVDSPAGTVRVGHSSYALNAGTNGIPDPIECDTTVYTAQSGAIVFASGTIYWGRALDAYDPFGYACGTAGCLVFPSVSAAAQQMTRNFLTKVLVNKAPVARMNGPYFVAPNQSVSFSGTSSSDAEGAIASYSWDFGDGSSATGATPTHAYAQAGRKVVTLTVTDGQGVPASTTPFADVSARLSAAVTASASASGYPAANANDGNDATLWAAFVGTPTSNNNVASFQLDFGVRKQIDRLKWHGASGSPYPAMSPTEYLIQVSDDGITWQTVVNHVGPTWIIDGNEQIDRVARYVRMRTSKVCDGSGWALGFYEIWAEGGDTTGRLAATAVASSSADAYPATNANDNVPGTLWAAFIGAVSYPNHNNTAWFELDFGRRKQIDRVKWLGAAGAPYPAMSPTNFVIEVSDDEVHWETVDNEVNPTWIVNGDRAVGRLARYLRMTTSKVCDGSGWSLGLFEFWAEGSEPPVRLPASPTASATAPVPYLQYESVKANDDDPNTLWAAAVGSSNTAYNTAWFQLDFGTPRQIDRIKWQSPVGTPYPAMPPHDYVIEVSNDANVWQTVVTRNNPSSMSCVDPQLVNGKEEIDRQARYVRIRTTKVCDGSGWGLAFLEFWAEGQ